MLVRIPDWCSKRPAPFLHCKILQVVFFEFVNQNLRAKYHGSETLMRIVETSIQVTSFLG